MVNPPDANDDLDRALVHRYLDGERAAGEELVNRFHRSVYNVALRMLGNVQDAEDVSQTVFGNAFSALDSYDPKYRFFSWIYRMTVNESLNTLKRRRRDVVSLDASFDAPADGESESAAEVEESVGRALLELKPSFENVSFGCGFHQMPLSTYRGGLSHFSRPLQNGRISRPPVVSR